MNGKNIVGIVGISMDITAQKQLEDYKSQQKETEKLQELKDYYEYIISKIPGHVYWIDTNNVYLGCNDEQATDVSLKDRKEIVGKILSEMVPPEDKTTLEKINNQVMQTGQPYTIEEDCYFPTIGNSTWFSKKVPLYNKKNQVIGMLGVSIDITDKKKAEKLKREQDIAQKTIRKLKAISAGLSYEVRGPMAGIRLGLDRTKYFFDKISQLIKSMKDCSKCQSHSELTSEDIIDQQLLLNKMKQRIDASIVLMEMQLKNMITDHIEQRFFQSHKIKDSVDHAVSSFPMEEASLQNKIHIALQHDFTVPGDGLLTKHLLWNLLNNALYFIKEEGRGEIFIMTEEMIEYYLLRFKDTAKGMAVSETKKVFDPFYTTRNNASGLGLHFCQLVMKAYGGKIECCAQEGKQAEFLLFFPKETVKKNRKHS